METDGRRGILAFKEFRTAKGAHTGGLDPMAHPYFEEVAESGNGKRQPRHGRCLSCLRNGLLLANERCPGHWPYRAGDNGDVRSGMNAHGEWSASDTRHNR